jgi:hypothetical protein
MSVPFITPYVSHEQRDITTLLALFKGWYKAKVGSEWVTENKRRGDIITSLSSICFDEDIMLEELDSLQTYLFNQLLHP